MLYHVPSNTRFETLDQFMAANPEYTIDKLMTIDDIKNAGLAHLQYEFTPYDMDLDEMVTVGQFQDGEIWRAQTEIRLKPWLDLEQVKSILTRRVNQIRDSHEQGGFMYLDHRFDSDEKATQRIANTAIAAMNAYTAGIPLSIAWIDADNQPVVMDALQLVGMQGALVQHAAACHTRATELKDLIRSAATIEYARSFDINAGWPV